MVDRSLTLDGQTYGLTFSDEFNAEDTRFYKGHGRGNVWTTSFSPHMDDRRFLASNGEGQYYVDPSDRRLPNPFSQQDGVLSINAFDLNNQQQSQAAGQPFASGMMATELSFSMASGYVEMRADVADQQGFLSAFWLLPKDGDWSAEIDVFEMVGGSLDNVVTTAVWDHGERYLQSHNVNGVDNGFHTYGLKWTDTELEWYVDDTLVRRSANTVQEDMYLVFSLAVETTWTRAPDETTDFSDAFEIDYVRVYELQDETAAPSISDEDWVFNPKAYGGTRGDDALFGTRFSDKISGQGGNDEIYGRLGKDKLFGRKGDDHLIGGHKADLLVGGSGADTLSGGKGHDVLKGGSGNDHIWGGQFGDGLGNDCFVLSHGMDSDFIHDFQLDRDLLDLRDFDVAWADIAPLLQNRGWATYLSFATLGGDAEDEVFLLNVNTAELTEDHFVF